MVLCNEMPQFLYAPQATLEEVTEADLLLHVLDASSPQVLQQRAAVLEVRRQGFYGNQSNCCLLKHAGHATWARCTPA